MKLIGVILLLIAVNGNDGDALSAPDTDFESLGSLKVLTFEQGKFAVRRKTPHSLPQLNCIFGCTGDLPKIVRCESTGFDGREVIWACTAKVEKGIKLRNTKVSCEAYNETDTQIILKGSCVLHYGLAGFIWYRRRPPLDRPSEVGSKGLFQYVVPIIMLVIFVVIVYAVVKACRKSNENFGAVLGAPPGQPGTPYGDGGAYPAQPGFNPNYQPGFGPNYQPGYAAPMAQPMTAPNRGGGSALGAGLGGFAAGAATGGLLGYMMGNHGNSGQSYGPSYGTYGIDAGDNCNISQADDGGGYEMSTDFADTNIE